MKSKNLLDIVFENDQFLAVNKPAGLLTIPDRHDEHIPSLYQLLQKKYEKIFIVHRLDRETSGLLLFAKDEVTHKYLNQVFELRKVEKFYLGLVTGSPGNASGIMEYPISEHPTIKGMMVIDRKGKPSQTEYQVIEDYGIYSLVKFQLHSGRTHQIRVHSKQLGHPLACDEVYGNGKPILLSSFKKKFKLSASEEEERPMLNRIALHSYELIFKGPDGKDYDIKADLPKDMQALLNQLKKNRR